MPGSIITHDFRGNAPSQFSIDDEGLTDRNDATHPINSNELKTTVVGHVDGSDDHDTVSSIQDHFTNVTLTEPSPPVHAFKVMSWDLDGLGNKDVPAIIKEITRENPDIICIQV